MHLLVALVAGTVAILACIAAWRARVSVHRLALEMVQLRERLSRAEQAYRDAAARAGAVTDPRGPAHEEIWGQRVAQLEGRLRSALERQAVDRSEDPDTEVGEAPHAVVRRYLRSRGFTDVVVLEVDGEGRVLVEAERGGIWTKGHAVVDADGGVQLRSTSSVRAFP